ncbi:MAG: serine/threonine protein kinase [Myxococcota bacterium]
MFAVQPVRFGKYVLLERLAAGGMGEVFLAKAGTHGVERFFAIKRILTQHEGSDDFAEMLLHEARVAITLGHPIIAQVIEFGQVDGHFFLAMEFVRGTSVAGLLRYQAKHELRLPVTDALWVAQQTCRALDYAYNKASLDGTPLHIVHRDVSPQNILIDDTGSVKLIDFGIAKAAMSLLQTEADTIKGKIPYMSPEQARAEPLDARSDLYSLGVVLFEMLSNSRMYPTGNTLDTLRMVAMGEVPDLDETLGAYVPGNVLRVLHRALAFARNERFSNAAEFERELTRTLHELDPGYTSHGLAERVLALEAEQPERRERLHSYARLSVSEFFDTALEVPGTPSERAVTKSYRPSSPQELGTATGAAEAIGLDEPEPRYADVPTVVSGAAVAAEAAPALATPQVAHPAVPSRIVPIAIAAAAASMLGVALWGVTHAPEEVAPPAAPSQRVASTEVAALSEIGHGIVVDAPPPTDLARPKANVAAEIAEAPAPQAPRRKSPAAAQGGPRTTTKNAAAAPGGEGCVSIVVEPWAYVSVEGRRVGTAPMACLKQPAGNVTLVLENPALGAARTVTVTVPAGGTAKVYEKL